MPDRDRTVAIACQGGGSHTAFTAGVLGELLDDVPDGHRITGLSGTSGGAICAALGWYGYGHEEKTATELLEEFWARVAASTPQHKVTNALVQWHFALQRSGVPMPEVSPAHSPVSRWASNELRDAIEALLDFSTVDELVTPAAPGLIISAIDVCSGQFHTFREQDLQPEVLLASAAEPHLFEAVEIDGNYYWDGLFAKNPPISDFMEADDLPDPDEIWVVKINPRSRDRPPRSLEGIDNRRNELSGNLSLTAEVGYLEQINQWINAGYLPDRYTHTEIRHIRLPRANRLDWRTKLDRDEAFINSLIESGREEAQAFRREIT